MNFLNKIESNNDGEWLSFLKAHGFEWGNCAYGRGNGWINGYASSEGLYWNRVRVWEEKNEECEADGKIWVEVFQEYMCGGKIWDYKSSITWEDATEESVLQLINEELPDDLD